VTSLTVSIFLSFHGSQRKPHLLERNGVLVLLIAPPLSQGWQIVPRLLGKIAEVDGFVNLVTFFIPRA
jgi:hypothetical protein